MKAKAWLLFCGEWTLNWLSRDAPRGLTNPIPWRHQDFQIPLHSLVFFHPWMETLEAKKKALFGEINHRNDQTLIHQAVEDLAGLKKDEEGVYESETAIVGPDPGKKSAATWA
jgi:hypothetical protein